MRYTWCYIMVERNRLSFGPVKVAKLGDRAIIIVPKPLRPLLLGKRVLVDVVLLE